MDGRESLQAIGQSGVAYAAIKGPVSVISVAESSLSGAGNKVIHWRYPTGIFIAQGVKHSKVTLCKISRNPREMTGPRCALEAVQEPQGSFLR